MTGAPDRRSQKKKKIKILQTPQILEQIRGSTPTSPNLASAPPQTTKKVTKPNLTSKGSLIHIHAIPGLKKKTIILYVTIC